MFRDLGIAFAIGLLIGLKRDGEQRNLEATEQLAGARRYELPGLAFNHWKTQTFIAGLRNDGLVAPWIIDTPMTKAIFEIYVETQLAPTLEAGDVVICDNLASHKSERANEILKERGAWFLFLPPYSPDLNPIEMAFSKLKAHLRRIGARTIDVWKAVGSICDLYSPAEYKNLHRSGLWVRLYGQRYSLKAESSLERTRSNISLPPKRF